VKELKVSTGKIGHVSSYGTMRKMMVEKEQSHRHKRDLFSHFSFDFHKATQ